MHQYLDLLDHIKEHGEVRKDRTGTGTLAVFGTQERYDLRKGFPAVTTKKLAWKAVVSELLWFLEGSNDERRLCEILHGTRDDNKTTIWTDNATADYWEPKAKFKGDVGNIYGVQWSEWESSQLSPIKIFNVDTQIPLPFSKSVVIDHSSNETGLLGLTFESNNHGAFTVIKEYKDGNNWRFDCQFLVTGYISRGATKQNITITKQVRDLYAPTRYGVGSIGDKSKIDPHIIELLESTWDGMLSRCYNSSDSNFFRYGGKGVHVDPRWLVFEYFAQDALKIENWDLKQLFPKKYTLDKDIKASNRYSVDTCVWATKKEQVHNSGFRELVQTEDGIMMRSVRFRNQIHHLINGLRKDPYGRRHILSAWNPGELSSMALPPCHIMSQFYVSNKGELSCHMYQRSVDAPLGMPFNIASYSLLTHMIAQVCGLTVGEFIHSTGDTHIYLNQLQGVDEQLLREPLPLPTLWLNPVIQDIDKFTMDDIKLVNYQHHPSINFPFST